MGRSQSDLPMTRTDQLQNQARSRRTNSLGKVTAQSEPSNLKDQSIVAKPNVPNQQQAPQNRKPTNQTPQQQQLNNNQKQQLHQQQQQHRQQQPMSRATAPVKNTSNIKPAQPKPMLSHDSKSLSKESSIGLTNSLPPSGTPAQQKMEIGSSIGQ